MVAKKIFGLILLINSFIWISVFRLWSAIPEVAELRRYYALAAASCMSFYSVAFARNKFSTRATKTNKCYFFTYLLTNGHAYKRLIALHEPLVKEFLTKGRIAVGRP